MLLFLMIFFNTTNLLIYPSFQPFLLNWKYYCGTTEILLNDSNFRLPRSHDEKLSPLERDLEQKCLDIEKLSAYLAEKTPELDVVSRASAEAVSQQLCESETLLCRESEFRIRLTWR